MQLRSRQTVEAVLDAVLRILKRDGVDAVTTNRIAEVAGVSVGSVYQYFPDKRAIFVALHDRHVEAMSQVVESTLVEQADAPLPALLGALLDALVDAHLRDPELYALLDAEVPHRAAGSFHARLRNALRLAIASRTRVRNLDKVLFVVTQMVDALSHGVALDRPPHLSTAVARQEAVRAILAYLRVVTRSAR
jgi:AcrR family transcriptional regulator